MSAPQSSSQSFDDFNRAQGMGSVRDPYPDFAALRARGPILQIEPRDLLGDAADALPSEGLPDVWSAVSFDAVAEVLRDAKRFSSAGYALQMGPVMGRTILEMDPPEHGRYRGLLQTAFLAKALERWERGLVRPIIEAAVDRFAARGSADLVRELTFPFPVSVIAGMIGLSEEDHAEFHHLAIELISFSFDPARGLAASASLRGLFARVLAERRADPRDDLVSVLAHAELDGTRLEDESIYSFLRLLAPAGAETTYRSSSNLLFGLLSNPEQLEALRADPSQTPAAIEEGLRWECPLTGIMRTSTMDTEVCGVAVPANAMIHVNLGAANRDDSRWPEPDRFDITRTPRGHMAFAFGPHRCLGQQLALMETRVLLEVLLERLRDLRLDPEVPDLHITGLIFRAPSSLPVRFRSS